MINISLIGALTSKPYAFTARSWELKSIETIDLFDSTCSNIRTDIRGSEIMRILPVNNEYVNEEWISDKTRFAYDGLKRWRFTNPLIKQDNIFIQVSWQEAFNKLIKLKENNDYKNIIINSGNFTDLETILCLKKLANKLDNVIINPDISIDVDQQSYYLPLENFNNVSNKIFILIGLNLRFENPILNIKFKKLSEQKNILLAYIGPNYNYNINNFHLGNNLNTLMDILSGKHKFLSIIKQFYKLKKLRSNFQNDVQLLFGNQFVNLYKSNLLLKALKSLIQSQKSISFSINTLPSYTGQINAYEFNLLNNNSNISHNTKTLHYLVGTEKSRHIKKNDLVIFQGHHNDLDRTKFDIILPSFTWTEKSSLYLNNNSVVQKTNISTTSLSSTRNDWKITRMISIILSNDIKYDNILEIHKDLCKYSPNILSSINKFELFKKYSLKIKNNFIDKSFVNKNTLNNFNVNFYNSTALERSSKIMNNCSKTLSKTKNNFLK